MASGGYHATVWLDQARVVSDEAGSGITKDQSMNGSVSKATKSELSQHPFLTEETLRTTEMK